MKIVLFGATGNIGQRLLAEALQRGHTVTAVVRDLARLTVAHERLHVTVGSVTDPENVAVLSAGHEAVFGSISGRRDGSASVIPEAARSLIEGVQKAGVKRLLWVGGASSLEVAPGLRLIDAPGFPEEYKPEGLAQAEALAAFLAAPEGVDWTYLSPAAEIFPGERTGTFRLGGDQFLTDADGRCRISMEDYAVALFNELERPQHTRQRFCIAY